MKEISKKIKIIMIKEAIKRVKRNSGLCGIFTSIYRKHDIISVDPYEYMRKPMYFKELQDAMKRKFISGGRKPYFQYKHWKRGRIGFLNRILKKIS